MNKLKRILCFVLPIMVAVAVTLGAVLPFALSKRKEEGLRNFIADGVKTRAASVSGAELAPTSQKGGSIYLEPYANYTMNGGTISGSSNVYGGAIFISTGATFTMNDGTISGCLAEYGGGIYVSAGATLTINSGTITGCTASKEGPAIYIEDGAIVDIDESANVDKNDVYTEGGSVSSDLIQVGNTNSTTYLHYLEFGSYPQTYVGDEMNTTLENWFNANNPVSVKTYYIGPSSYSGKSFLGKGKQDNVLAATPSWEDYDPAYLKLTYEAYEYGGELYARGKCYPWMHGEGDTTIYKYKDGTIVKAREEICWFKVEPIVWVVLNYDEWEAGASLQIMSLNVIVANMYFNEAEWSESNIRKWMNYEFLNSAFTEEERQKITPTTLKNNETDSYTMGSGQDTIDNVYILNEDELSNALPTADSRMVSPTDFALSLFSSFWFAGGTMLSYDYSTTYRNGVCGYMCRQKTYSYGNITVRYDGGFNGEAPAYEKPQRPVLCLNI